MSNVFPSRVFKSKYFPRILWELLQDTTHHFLGEAFSLLKLSLSKDINGNWTMDQILDFGMSRGMAEIGEQPCS